MFQKKGYEGEREMWCGRLASYCNNTEQLFSQHFTVICITWGSCQTPGSDSVGLRQGMSFNISNKLRGDAHARTTL